MNDDSLVRRSPLISSHCCHKTSLKGLTPKCLTSLNPSAPSPVIAHVEGIKALGEALHIGGADSLQEIDVVLRVEAAHVMLGGLVWLEDLGMEKQDEPRQDQPH